jgi:hypothetical protein
MNEHMKEFEASSCFMTKCIMSMFLNNGLVIGVICTELLSYYDQVSKTS